MLSVQCAVAGATSAARGAADIILTEVSTTYLGVLMRSA